MDNNHLKKQRGVANKKQFSSRTLRFERYLLRDSQTPRDRESVIEAKASRQAGAEKFFPKLVPGLALGRELATLERSRAWTKLGRREQNAEDVALLREWWLHRRHHVDSTSVLT